MQNLNSSKSVRFFPFLCSSKYELFWFNILHVDIIQHCLHVWIFKVFFTTLKYGFLNCKNKVLSVAQLHYWFPVKWWLLFRACFFFLNLLFRTSCCLYRSPNRSSSHTFSDRASAANLSSQTNTRVQRRAHLRRSPATVSCKTTPD